MKRFYIIYKDTVSIEGKVNCTEEEFVEKFITPLKNEIHIYKIWDSLEQKEIEELILEL